MGDDVTKILISLFGTIATILLGLIAKGILSVYDKQTRQEERIALLEKDVKPLTEWKAISQASELEDYKRTIRELKEKNESH